MNQRKEQQPQKPAAQRELEKFLFHTFDEDAWKNDQRSGQQRAEQRAGEHSQFKSTWQKVNWNLN